MYQFPPINLFNHLNRSVNVVISGKRFVARVQLRQTSFARRSLDNFRSRTTIVKVFDFLTSVDIRLRIQHFILHTRFRVRHNTTDSRQQCSCFQRSATMFAVFLHCIAVLCVVVMSHPQPSLLGTGVLWVSTVTHGCVDPPRHGGGSTMRQLVRCVDCGCRA